MEDRTMALIIILAVLFTAGDIITTALFVGNNGIEEGNSMPNLVIAKLGIMEGLVVFKTIFLGIALSVVFLLNRLNFKMLAGGFATILFTTGLIATINNIMVFMVPSYHGLQEFWVLCFLIFFLSILLNTEWRIGIQKLLWKEKIFPPLNN